jgi:hypothetical protein
MVSINLLSLNYICCLPIAPTHTQRISISFRHLASDLNSKQMAAGSSIHLQGTASTQFTLEKALAVASSIMLLVAAHLCEGPWIVECTQPLGSKLDWSGLGCCETLDWIGLS